MLQLTFTVNNIRRLADIEPQQRADVLHSAAGRVRGTLEEHFRAQGGASSGRRRRGTKVETPQSRPLCGVSVAIEASDEALRSDRLVAEGEAHEEILVQIGVGALGVVEHLAALGDQHQQAAAGSMVMLVGLEVLGKVDDTLGHHGHLETGGTGVLLVRLEVVDVDFAHCSVYLV